MLQKTYRNVNTVTGRNYRFVENKVGVSCDLLKVSSGWLKSRIKFCDISMNEMWRVNLIKEITNINQNALMFHDGEECEDSFLTRNQLQEIVDFVSAS